MIGVMMLDIGTHMAACKLPSGKFLLLDTIKITPGFKEELDKLTNNGEVCLQLHWHPCIVLFLPSTLTLMVAIQLIEAVIATHPFHTLYFKEFYDAYPNAKYYGTPRHMKKITDIPWISACPAPYRPMQLCNPGLTPHVRCDVQAGTGHRVAST